MPGEVVAVDRHYFQNTGAYDPLMSLRGGENLEMSFKVCPVPREDIGGVFGTLCMVTAWRQPSDIPWVRDDAVAKVDIHDNEVCQTSHFSPFPFSLGPYLDFTLSLLNLTFKT